VGSTDFIYIPGEIGVGAGILLGRRLFRGMRGFSVEFGRHHTPGRPAVPGGTRDCWGIWRPAPKSPRPVRGDS